MPILFSCYNVRMALDLNPLVYNPSKSHRKTILIPPESEKLAELIGIIHGDGGNNNPWQLVITMNSNSDLEYSQYVKNLINSLFDIKIAIRKRRNRNAIVLVSSGRNLIDFLVRKGAVRGNKVKQQIDAPNWIMNNELYKINFVRGLVDTDGCLYIHKHFTKQGSKLHQNIGLCFSNSSLNLIKRVSRILKGNKIEPHISKNKKNVYLYSLKSVKNYLDIFGSSNPRIINKYNEWLNIR